MPETTTYITLGLIDRDGAPCWKRPVMHVKRALHQYMAALLPERATVYTFAIGTGIDEQGAEEPCAIWALGGLTEDHARTVAEALAQEYNQRCVAVTQGQPSFVAPPPTWEGK